MTTNYHHRNNSNLYAVAKLNPPCSSDWHGWMDGCIDDVRRALQMTKAWELVTIC